MIRELLLLGFVTLAFGLGASQTLGGAGPFAIINIAVGVIALGGGAFVLVGRLGRIRQASSRKSLAESILGLVAVVWGVWILQGLAATTGLRWDWTFEGHYELSPAIREVVDLASGPLSLTLYKDSGDPRIRRTRLLLDEVAALGDVIVRERVLDDWPEDEDRFGIAGSNSVVVELGHTWDIAKRPTEGALYEAISRVVRNRDKLVYVGVGTGEGDLEKTDDLGFSGLAAALWTEGYVVQKLPTSLVSDIPADADGVILISPQRGLPDTAVRALEQYLERGGRLIAFLDPGIDSGLEDLLGRWGLTPRDGVVIDADSVETPADPAGLRIVTGNYWDHPARAGLTRNRMTVFRASRAFALSKPQPSDKVSPIVSSGGNAWLYPSPSDLLSSTRRPDRPDGVRTEFLNLVVAGRYERGEHETRIAAFGDSGFATNRDLRTLYNLDLMMNVVHWTLDQLPSITIRPKSAPPVQFPLPVSSSLKAFYGVGLVVPEILLILGGITWLRRRTR